MTYLLAHQGFNCFMQTLFHAVQHSSSSHILFT